MQTTDSEKTLGLDLTELLKEQVERESPQVTATFYPGKVVANNDPEKLGRCQIRVFGIFSESIPDQDLPWALPDIGFTGSKVGNFVGPPVDALVNVYFDNDDLYMPKYTTKVSLTKKELKGMVSNPLGDYPHTMVFFETDEGDFLKMNRQTGEMTFNHRSGASIMITKSGHVVIDNANTENGGFDLNIKGNIRFQAGGDIELNTMGRIKLSAPMGTSNFWQPNCIPVCPFTGQPHTMSPGLTGSK